MKNIYNFFCLLIAITFLYNKTTFSHSKNINNNSEKFFINELTKNTKYEHEIAITAMFQNEAPYLKEWIEYHKLIGITHFYLYNNLSEDNYHDVLKPYLENKEVELYEWPFKAEQNTWCSIQTDAFLDAIKRANGKVKWLAILDLDEFLVPVQDNTMIEFLSQYEEYAAVTLNWQIFGTSFVEKIPDDKLMIEMLILKAVTNHKDNHNTKSIVRPEFLTSFKNQHSANYLPGYYAVDTNKKKQPNVSSKKVLVDKALINHYWSRDEYFFRTIKIPRREFFATGLDYMQRYKEINVEKDTLIHKYLKDLKKGKTNEEL